MKTPRPDKVSTPEDRRHFEREAGTWVNLGLHPHTVNCVYVRTIDAAPRVFAEWVDGGSVADAVRHGGLTPARILDIAVQTAWGLAHAHEAGLVHQDIKPANVMLDPEGTAKVTDFGLARALQSSESSPVGVSFGGMTPAYCSPEQADAMAGQAGVRITAASDVWSWGVTVLEMFAGRRTTTYGEAADAALTLLLAEGLRLPSAVSLLLRACFADDPGQRPTALDVAAQLIDSYPEVAGAAYPRARPKWQTARDEAGRRHATRSARAEHSAPRARQPPRRDRGAEDGRGSPRQGRHGSPGGHGRARETPS